MLFFDMNVEKYTLELYQLLKDRPPEANISHKKMPTCEEHEHFVENHPYLDWLIIREGRNVVGSVYITHQREVGIAIFKEYQGKGYGQVAVKVIHERYPGPLYANIAPGNEASRAFFLAQGFELVQHTYKLKEL